MRKYLFIFIAVIATSCATAQPGQWNTKNKKAIKYIEQAMKISRERDMTTGMPKYAEALSLIHI